ncbi:MAG: cobalt ECF transporter T component CbiQ [Clostridia bacterium]|jgi:cobalt/nickel transport system permease protein|nr:cobalt ECF transporter T component CbiQ [Clostridia bacterium]
MRKESHYIDNLRLLELLARQKSVIHQMNPLVKLLTTVIYVTVVISFERYEFSALLPLLFYPALVLAFSGTPVAPILKRVLLAQVFVIGIGIWNPFFDTYPVMFGGLSVSRGWLSFLSLILKSILAVTALFLLIATTGMERTAQALRMLKIPKIFVLQLLLTYRYITVLLEEAARMTRAYALRAPRQKGIHRSAWGSFLGQLLLRTVDRGERVHEAMLLRGFTGEYHTGAAAGAGLRDWAYLAGWGLFFILVRAYNLPVWLGTLLTGAMIK